MHGGSKAKMASSQATQEPEGNDRQVRWQLFLDHQKLAWENIQSSTDSYDQGLLTFASGGLGLSIAFIKDIVPLDHATYLCLLYTSWIAFTICILITIGSFQVAIKTQKEHIDRCYRYYVDDEENLLTEQGRYAKLLRIFTIASGVCFILALACTVAFAGVNVNKEAHLKNADKDDAGIRSTATDGRNAVPITSVPATSGASTEERGQPAPPITKPPGRKAQTDQGAPKTDSGAGVPAQTTQSDKD